MGATEQARLGAARDRAAARLPLWAIGGLVAALTALQMVRRPSAPPLWDSLIAEDGKIFLSQAVSEHFLDSLATSYQGYLHTVPRVIALAATWFPLGQAPLVMSLLATLLVALLAVYVFHASAAWIASPILRGVLALAVPFIPVTAREMSGTVSNLHWYLLYAAFWAVICPWRTRGWLAISTAVVALAVLSDPLTVVLLPIALVFALRGRERHAWILPGCIVLGLVLQLALRDQGTSSFGGSDYGVLPRLFAERVTSSLLVGDRYLKDVFGGTTGSPFAWASLAAVAVAVGLGLWRLRDRRAWLLAGGTALSLTFFLIPAITRGTRFLSHKAPWGLTGTRYVYLPVLFLLTGLLAAVDRRTPGDRRPRVREIVVAVAVLATMVVGYAAPHRSSGELRWKPVLAKARVACATRTQIPPIRLYRQARGLGALLPIDPARWSIQIDCSKLR